MRGDAGCSRWLGSASLLGKNLKRRFFSRFKFFGLGLLGVRINFGPRTINLRSLEAND